MYLDASAIVAILASEPDGLELSRQINGYERALYVSPLTLYEATMSLAAKLARETGMRNDAALIGRAQQAVSELVASIGAEEIQVSPEIGRAALGAAKLYGKSVGHPAQLNFGDCFAYACAKAKSVPLLYKGKDFSETDLA
ncbi:type II toxin-antitoxin system VapC family toxin [Bosea caraganae]|uniref:Type II toxin-antitoxin system VapC family toxin n=1 Tax=Bosea caraganae TaxID=2763117 RepID=A0A370LAW5_9HYPH|nr:type II toxin-antitoxin system VapC family toxin [Bosea caraganae]RDJ27097.1 type II toxin-antitoxin system VapC family toxin [Bosea caraganae]RDJ29114.1 type II toxin-antitoxin system VapC family toxin [Bosea caraganae]